MTPRPDQIRRMLDHARTAARALEKIDKAYDQQVTERPLPEEFGQLYARAYRRVNQLAQEMGR